MHQIAPLTTSKCKKFSLWEGGHPPPLDRGGGGGGTPTHFFRTISGHHLHYWVGVPSVHNTDLRGDKQKKKKKKSPPEI